MTTQLSWRARGAIGALRATNALSRRLGRGAGTVAGGRVGLTLDPDLVAHLSRGREVILVTGTNGKTTTSAMVRAGWGGDVAANTTGANMPEGHAAALATSRASRVVLETDEAWLARAVADTTPTVVVLLNLSRDQLDRATEVRALAQRWRECLAVPGGTMVVVANAADPLVVYAAEVATDVRWVDVPSTWHGDAASCPKCTRALTFTASSWWCSCGFAPPAHPRAHVDRRVTIGGEPYDVELALPGQFNRVNATFAALALEVVGVELAAAFSRISTLSSVQGRYGDRRFGSHRVRLLLAKNPAGTAALWEALEASDEVWMAINAHVADGKDPSWLYDVPCEALRGRRVMCLGERRLDLATRLTYEDIDAIVVDDPATLTTGDAPVTLIANYTAFREWMQRTERW